MTRLPIWQGSRSKGMHCSRLRDSSSFGGYLLPIHLNPKMNVSIEPSQAASKQASPLPAVVEGAESKSHVHGETVEPPRGSQREKQNSCSMLVGRVLSETLKVKAYCVGVTAADLRTAVV